jgi:hypothetical protein
MTDGRLDRPPDTPGPTRALVARLERDHRRAVGEPAQLVAAPEESDAAADIEGLLDDLESVEAPLVDASDALAQIRMGEGKRMRSGRGGRSATSSKKRSLRHASIGEAAIFIRVTTIAGDPRSRRDFITS